MTRVALYARYSSDNQRDASIEDQLRQSRDYAERQGWAVVESYIDRAISGASLIRSGIQKLMADVQTRQFDIVLSEALDRISRDQEDVAAVAGIRKTSPPCSSGCALPVFVWSLCPKVRSANSMSALRAP